MATKFKLEHEFPDIPMSLFEEHLNHPELNEMMSNMPAFRSRELVETQKMNSGEIIWRFKVVAGGEIPPAVQKVLSADMFSWWENSRFVPSEHCIHFNIEPVVAKGKFEGGGRWQLYEHGKGTRRVIEGEMNVKIPFVGKLVEGFLVNELKRNFEVEPEIQSKFYAKMKKKK